MVEANPEWDSDGNGEDNEWDEWDEAEQEMAMDFDQPETAQS